VGCCPLLESPSPARLAQRDRQPYATRRPANAAGRCSQLSAPTLETCPETRLRHRENPAGYAGRRRRPAAHVAGRLAQTRPRRRSKQTAPAARRRRDRARPPATGAAGSILQRVPVRPCAVSSVVYCNRPCRREVVSRILAIARQKSSGLARRQWIKSGSLLEP